MGLRLCKVVHPAPSWMAQSSTLKILPYYIVVAECMVLFTVIGFYGNLGVKQGLPWKLFGLFVLSLGWDMELREGPREVPREGGIQAQAECGMHVDMCSACVCVSDGLGNC